MKLKLITGFGQDEKCSIDVSEAHKAYYLYNNPEKRGVFDNGLAIEGRDIKRIIPDWNGTMGWNNTHKLDDDDWNDIRGKKMDMRMNDTLYLANKVAKLAEHNPILLEMELEEAQQSLPESKEYQALNEETKKLADKFKIS